MGPGGSALSNRSPQDTPRASRITRSIDPAQKCEPTATDFDGNRLEIGYARFSIFSDVGESTTGARLYGEHAGKDHQAQVPWRLVVVPRPALGLLAEAMEKLALAGAEEAMRRPPEGGIDVLSRTAGAERPTPKPSQLGGV